MIYIVDIGCALSGRTIEVKGTSAKKVYEEVYKNLDRWKCEKILQIRDEQGRFYYCDEKWYV